MENNKNTKKAINFLAKLNIAVIALAFIGISCYLLFANRSTISSIESRALAEYPKFTLKDYFAGKYNSDMQTWFTDTAPDRDTYKNSIVYIKHLFGVSPDLKYYGNDDDTSSEDERPSGEVSDPFADYSRDDSEESRTDELSGVNSEEESHEDTVSDPETSEESSAEQPDVEFGIVNDLLIIGNRCMESFGGEYSSGQLYAKYVSNYKKDLGDKVNVYSMVIPVASSIYLTGNYYDKYGGKQIDKINYIIECLKDTGVKPVDIYETLKSHKEEEIYFRTDHHWTMLGAYYAAEVLANTADVQFKQLYFPGSKTINESNYKLNGKFNEDGSSKAFLGSLYGKTKAKVLLDNPETFFWYEYMGKYTCNWYSYDYSELKMTKDSCFLNVSDAYVSAWYMIFMDGDNYSLKITTDAGNGRVAVVFKDSFGNALIPAMLSSFETIYAIDMRYFPLDSIDFIQKVGATDVVFAVSSFTALGINYKYIEQMRVVNTQKYIGD
ncbi:MAG: DHHW family protein [Eubacteriales bacterium]|nr:DHHW family protein [Eubacteriales bacterium]